MKIAQNDLRFKGGSKKDWHFRQGCYQMGGKETSSISRTIRSTGPNIQNQRDMTSYLKNWNIFQSQGNCCIYSSTYCPVGTDVAQRPIWPEYITPFSIRQVKLSCCNWYWSTANLILISRIIRGRNIFGQTLGLGEGLCFGSDRILNLYILISDTEVFQLNTIVNFILPAPQLTTTEHHNCLLPNIPQLSTPLCGGWPLRMPSSC